MKSRLYLLTNLRKKKFQMTKWQMLGSIFNSVHFFQMTLLLNQIFYKDYRKSPLQLLSQQDLSKMEYILLINREWGHFIPDRSRLFWGQYIKTKLPADNLKKTRVPQWVVHLNVRYSHVTLVSGYLIDSCKLTITWTAYPGTPCK